MPSNTNTKTCKTTGALYSYKKIVTSKTKGARSVISADFDGDGFPDLATASSRGHSVSVFRNLATASTKTNRFGPRVEIDDEAYGAWSVWSADLDSDGDLDIISVSSNDDTMGWYKNNGKGSFGSEILITEQCICGMSVVAADFDNDGHLDLLVSMMNSNSIAWYRNTDGKGAFSSEIFVDTDANKAMDAIAVDINNDGWMDIVACIPGNNRVVWYLNLQNGLFSDKKDVSEDERYPYSIIAGDFDGDGDQDLAGASQDDGKIVWYQNDGLGNFDKKWELTDQAAGTRSVIQGDFNNDGFLDIACASQDDDSISWFMNMDGLGNFSQRIVVSNTSDGAQSVYAADIDQDGHLDLFSASNMDNTISWYENFKYCCPTGYGTKDQIHCVACEPGYYSSDKDSEKCIKCDVGKYSKEVGAISATSCLSCELGRYGISSEEGCLKCPAGKYGGSEGNIALDSCIDCIAGTYTNKSGVSFCTKCSIGKWLTEIGSSDDDNCIECTKGKYSDETGRNISGCIDCPFGQSNNQPGRSNCPDWDDGIIYGGICCLLVFVLVAAFLFHKLKGTVEKEKKRASRVQRNLELQVQMTDKFVEHVLNPLEQSKYVIEPSMLKLGKKVGQGGNGFIFKSTLGASTVVAAKEIMSALWGDVKEFENEAIMLTELNHPHVLRVFGFCNTPANKNIKFDTDHKYIVTEFAPNGSLEALINASIEIKKTQIIHNNNNGSLPRISSATSMKLRYKSERNAQKIEREGSDSIKFSKNGSFVFQDYPYTKMQALTWAIEIASGMAYLHSRTIIHRDMKPGNILLDASNKALVADLGTARRCQEDGTDGRNKPRTSRTQSVIDELIDIERNGGDNSDDSDDDIEKMVSPWKRARVQSAGHQQEFPDVPAFKTSRVGTAFFMAPEQINTKEYSYPADVWAWGISMAQMFSFEYPYKLKNYAMVPHLRGVSTGKKKPRRVKLEEVPHLDVFAVINQCLEFDPKKRPTFEEIETRLCKVKEICVLEAERTKKKGRRCSVSRSSSL